MSEQAYVYLFVREDLSPAQQIIQVAHAIEELTKHYARLAAEYPKETKEFVTDDTNFMVLFAVKNEKELLTAVAYLTKKEVLCQPFFEPDIAQWTAIATEPLRGSRRKIMEIFKLKE